MQIHVQMSFISIFSLFRILDTLLYIALHLFPMLKLEAQ